MFTIDFGRKSDLAASEQPQQPDPQPCLRSVSVEEAPSEPTLQSLYVVLAWICINILPQMSFVSKSDKIISVF